MGTQSTLAAPQLGKSQLDLSFDTGISQCHPSFVESGSDGTGSGRETPGTAETPAAVSRRSRAEAISRPAKSSTTRSVSESKQRFSHFSLITTLGTPQCVTAQELRVECMFPASRRQNTY